MNKIDNSGAGIATLGRDEDAYMAHVAAGEMVVPPVISPETRARLFQEMQQVGLDPNEYTVGEGMSINPITGMPEFGFLKKVFKSVKKVAKKAAPIVLPMMIPGVGGALSGALGGIGGAIGTGIKTLIPGSAGIVNAIGNVGSSILGGAENIRSGIGSFFGGGAGGGQYTVQPGDTLSEIAAANNTTVAELEKLNDIANPNMIMAGQPLTMPKAGGGLGSMFPGGLFGKDSFADKILNIDPNKGTGPLSFLSGQGQGQGQGMFGGGLGGGLGTLANLVVLKNLLDRPSPKDPSEVVPTGTAAFGYTPEMVAALNNQSYRIGNLQPALIQGQQYANINPENMPKSTPITMAEKGGEINPDRMDDDGPGDITPAFLEPGEFVITRPATRVLGARNLYKLMKEAEQMA